MRFGTLSEFATGLPFIVESVSTISISFLFNSHRL